VWGEKSKCESNRRGVMSLSGRETREKWDRRGIWGREEEAGVNGRGRVRVGWRELG